eukprot:900250_1
MSVSNLNKVQIQTLSENEVTRVLQEESQKRRIQRLCQVRSQSRFNAREKQLEMTKRVGDAMDKNDTKISADWVKSREDKLCQLRSQLSNCLESVGSAHTGADVFTQNLVSHAHLMREKIFRQRVESAKLSNKAHSIIRQKILDHERLAESRAMWRERAKTQAELHRQKSRRTQELLNSRLPSSLAQSFKSPPSTSLRNQTDGPAPVHYVYTETPTHLRPTDGCWPRSSSGIPGPDHWSDVPEPRTSVPVPTAGGEKVVMMPIHVNAHERSDLEPSANALAVSASKLTEKTLVDEEQRKIDRSKVADDRARSILKESRMGQIKSDVEKALDHLSAKQRSDGFREFRKQARVNTAPGEMNTAPGDMNTAPDDMNTAQVKLKTASDGVKSVGYSVTQARPVSQNIIEQAFEKSIPAIISPDKVGHYETGRSQPDEHGQYETGRPQPDENSKSEGLTVHNSGKRATIPATYKRTETPPPSQVANDSVIEQRFPADLPPPSAELKETKSEGNVAEVCTSAGRKAQKVREKPKRRVHLAIPASSSASNKSRETSREPTAVEESDNEDEAIVSEEWFDKIMDGLKRGSSLDEVESEKMKNQPNKLSPSETHSISSAREWYSGISSSVEQHRQSEISNIAEGCSAQPAFPPPNPEYGQFHLPTPSTSVSGIRPASTFSESELKSENLENEEEDDQEEDDDISSIATDLKPPSVLPPPRPHPLSYRGSQSDKENTRISNISTSVPTATTSSISLSDLTNSTQNTSGSKLPKVETSNDTTPYQTVSNRTISNRDTSYRDTSTRDTSTIPSQIETSATGSASTAFDKAVQFYRESQRKLKEVERANESISVSSVSSLDFDSFQKPDLSSKSDTITTFATDQCDIDSDTTVSNIRIEDQIRRSDATLQKLSDDLQMEFPETNDSLSKATSSISTPSCSSDTFSHAIPGISGISTVEQATPINPDTPTIVSNNFDEFNRTVEQKINEIWAMFPAEKDIRGFQLNTDDSFSSLGSISPHPSKVTLAQANVSSDGTSTDTSFSTAPKLLDESLLDMYNDVMSFDRDHLRHTVADKQTSDGGQLGNHARPSQSGQLVNHASPSQSCQMVNHASPSQIEPETNANVINTSIQSTKSSDNSPNPYSSISKRALISANVGNVLDEQSPAMKMSDLDSDRVITPRKTEAGPLSTTFGSIQSTDLDTPRNLSDQKTMIDDSPTSSIPAPVSPTCTRSDKSVSLQKNVRFLSESPRNSKRLSQRERIKEYDERRRKLSLLKRRKRASRR